MSLPNLTGTGRLITDVRRGATRDGGVWANCVVRFTGYRKADDDQWHEDSHVTATVVAFNDTARALHDLGLAKGDEVLLTARLKELTIWAPENGDPRPQLSLALVSAEKPTKVDRRDQALTTSGATQ